MASNDGRRRRERQQFVRFGDLDENPVPSQRRHFYPGSRSRDAVPRRGSVRSDGQAYSRPVAYGYVAAPVPRRHAANRMAEARVMPSSFRRRQSSNRDAFEREAVVQSVEAGGIPESADVAAFRYTDSPTPLDQADDDDDDDDDDEDLPKRRSFDDRRVRHDFYRDRSPSRSNDEQIIPERSRDYVYAPDGSKIYIEQVEEVIPLRRPPSPIVDDMDAFDDFNFVFPTEPSKEGDLSDTEAPSTETESTRKLERSPSTSPEAPGIYSSSYSGAAELGGLHSITLTTLHDPKGRKSPLFRWLHIRQEVMNFDELWIELSRQVRFSETERNAIARLRAEVKRQCIKSRYNPEGAKVGYMEPRYIQVALEPQNKKTADDLRTANWICIPYFSLQQYSRPLSTSNVALFPAQTLLQSQYSRSTQQRDMEQAVCQLGVVERGECFHIDQLWCLVLSNSLLVTCGTITQLELQGNHIKINSEPSQINSSGRILISYGGSVMWSLTTKECSTWFAFLSHFHAFWPRNLEFKRNNHVVSANTWNKVLRLAEGPRGSVTLKLSTIDPPEPPRAFLKPEKRGKTVSSDASPKLQTSFEYLHVLTLLPAGSGSSIDGILKSLHEQLASAETFLTERTSYSAQRCYKTCDVMTRGDVYTYLTNLAAKVEEKGIDSLRRAYDERIDIFNAADTLFQLFFPITFEGPTTSKFWGAIKKLMKIPGIDIDKEAPSNNHSPPITDIRSSLWQISQNVQVFENIMSFSGKKEREEMELPREFVTAWLHIVSGLIYCGQIGDWWGHLTKAKSLVREGMQKIIHSIFSQNLQDRTVMLPMEVLSLISLNLVQDQTGKYEDITETYSQYLNSLDTDITTKPSDRSYQHRIDLVNQEMTAIKRNITRQRNIITTIRYKTNSPDGTFAVRYGDELPSHMTRGRERDAWDREATPGRSRQAPGHQYYGVPEKSVGRIAYDYERNDDQLLNDLESASKLSSTDAGGFRSLFLAECASVIEQRDYEFRRNTEYAEDLEREISYRMEWTKDKQENAIYAFTLVTIVFLPISAISSIFGMNTNDIRNMDFNQWLYWVVAIPVTIIVIVGGLWWMNELSNVTRWIVGKKKSKAPEYRMASDATAVMMPQQVMADSNSVAESEDFSAYRRRPRSEMAPRTYTAAVSMPSTSAPMARRRRNSFYRY